MGSVLAGIIAIAKAIPAASKILDKLVMLWIHAKNENLEKESQKLKDERRKIVEQYEQAKTNEDKKRFFKDFIINNSK